MVNHKNNKHNIEKLFTHGEYTYYYKETDEDIIYLKSKKDDNFKN